MTGNNHTIRVGLEIHCQLNYLQTKLFCSCSSDYQNQPPNTNTCPVCLGYPGSLPNINGDAVKTGLKLAKALSMKPIEKLEFSRKHYEYPDLPKGFQITQSESLLGTDGLLPRVSGKLPIKQIQLEEDPAKIIYTKESYIIDFNRCGTPLIELVTDPIFSNLEEIKDFLVNYRRLLKTLGISDPYKESAFRVDLNISVDNHPRVEVKNIGSDAEILKAYSYEVLRQINEVDETVFEMETRHWDAENGVTIKSRSKESSADYRYMPEKDIPTIMIPNGYWENVQLPELPWELEKRLHKEYNLTNDQISILLDDQNLISIYEQYFEFFNDSISLMNKFFWNEFLQWYKVTQGDERKRLEKLDKNQLKKNLLLLANDKISNQQFKKALKKYILKNEFFSLKIEENKTNYESIEEVVNWVKRKYPDIWRESHIHPNKLNYLVGQAVKQSRGKFHPKEILMVLKNQ
ncbi:MAG: Asp-tRNA(Asn)/Glu-tRNA(Gln) amidotransferase subunit GatB [Candidatus Thorarchaeota archaeon]